MTAHAPAPRTVIFTDGGCSLKENGIGAFAWFSMRPDGVKIEFSYSMVHTTNNRMELMAVISAIKAHPEGPLKIFSDSKYVIEGACTWSPGWIRRGWKTAEGKPVLNRDLWEKLIARLAGRDILFEHVKGHAGHDLNERVDKLCTDAMNSSRSQLRHGKSVMVDLRE